MNVMHQKVGQWSEQHFDLKIQSKELVNLLQSKNGKLYKKLFLFMSDQIRSKEDGNQIKLFCESIRLQNELKTINEEFHTISGNVANVCNDLIEEENKKKCHQLEETLNRKRAILSSLIVNAIEKIVAKDKKDCFQFRPNLTAINQIGETYLKRLAPIEVNVVGSGDNKTFSKPDIDDIWAKINELVAQIGSVLYHLNQLKVQKPMKQNIDIAAIERCLADLKVETRAQPKNKKEFDAKRIAVAEKLENVNHLLNKYQTRRTEKLSKNKEKMEKVIHKCDEFIQTKRLKCCENK